MDSRKAGVATFIIALGVILGAFGAHSLKEILPADKLVSFETGVRYQLLMGISMLVLAFNSEKIDFSMKWVWLLMITGVICFSGSIYLLAIQSVISTDLSFLWPITPVGGLMLIIGWLWLTKNLLFKKNSRS